MGTWGHDVMLHPYTGIDLASIWDELEYEHYTLQSPNTKLPLHVFEAQPVVGKRITILNLQLDDDDVLSAVITGHTWHHPTSTKGGVFPQEYGAVYFKSQGWEYSLTNKRRGIHWR